MLLLLFRFLHDLYGIEIPDLLAYSSARMMLAAITTLLFTIFLGPFFIKKLYQLKTGQSIRVEDCPLLAELHQKKRNTPTMGGTLMLSSMIVSLLLWMDLTSVFTFILFIVTITMGVLGGIDDYLKMKLKNSKGLSGKKKLLVQIVVSALIGTYLFSPMVNQSLSHGEWLNPPAAKERVEIMRGEKVEVKMQPLTTQEYMSTYYLPFLKDPLFVLTGVGIILGVLFTVIVITGSSNAVNLTDGLDGLASGLLLLTSGVLAVFAFLSNHIELAKHLNILYIEGSGEIAVYLFAMIGACVGFLWYNGYPAQIFMGDTGSLALGAILGTSAVLLRRELLLAIAGGMFVLEAVSVIIQVLSYRYRGKKRVFLCAPIHHHFEYKGWPETKVVIRFWILGLILSIIALMSLKVQ